MAVVAAAEAATGAVVVRVCRYCRKRQTSRRHWPVRVAVRKTRCCTGHRDGDGSDGAGDVAAVVATLTAAMHGGRAPTNRAAACWTTRSGARTTDAEPPVVGPMVPTPPKQVLEKRPVNKKGLNYKRDIYTFFFFIAVKIIVLNCSMFSSPNKINYFTCIYICRYII